MQLRFWAVFAALGRCVATRWLFSFFFFYRLPGSVATHVPSAQPRPPPHSPQPPSLRCVVSFIRFKLHGKLWAIPAVLRVPFNLFITGRRVAAAVLDLPTLVLFYFFFCGLCWFPFGFGFGFHYYFFFFFFASGHSVIWAKNVAVAIWRLCYLCNSLRQLTFTCVLATPRLSSPPSNICSSRFSGFPFFPFSRFLFPYCMPKCRLWGLSICHVNWPKKKERKKKNCKLN